MIDIKVPTVGESITEVTLVKWLKNDGDYVERDEVIAELESEKATFEINAEKAGVLKRNAQEGDTLKIGDLAAQIDDSAAAPAKEAAPAPVKEAAPAPAEKTAAPAAAATVAPAAPPPPSDGASKQPEADVKASPVAAAILADKKLDVKSIVPSGSGGRILKNDVLEALSNPGRKTGLTPFSRNDKPEKMSNLRKTISRRLVEAKNSTAIDSLRMGPRCMEDASVCIAPPSGWRRNE